MSNEKPTRMDIIYLAVILGILFAVPILFIILSNEIDWWIF